MCVFFFFFFKKKRRKNKNITGQEFREMAAFLPVSSQWLHLKVHLTEHLNTISHFLHLPIFSFSLVQRSLALADSFCESRVRVRVHK